MDTSHAKRVEAAVDLVATTMFAAAAVVAVFELRPIAGVSPLAPALASGVVAGALCASLLRAVAPREAVFSMSQFELAAIPQPEFEELLLTELTPLVLTDADRLEPVQNIASNELVLDDILAQMGPDSRVVRLFDPAAMPTPAQLKSRIDRHLEQGSPHSSPMDASQALYDALSELRRSLR